MALALALGGCSQQPEDMVDPAVGGRKVSAAEMAVLLPDNSQITSVGFSITGPAMFSRTGTVNVTNSKTVKFRVSDIPVNATSPYSISLTATTSTGVMCGGGPTTFLMANNNVVAVMMTLTCGNDVDNSGDLQVNADVAGNCPVILGVSALPSEVFIGSDMALHVSTTAGPTGHVMWSGAGGNFSAAGSADTNFTCLVVGPHTLTVSLTEGTCSSTFTADVECSDGGINLVVCGDGDIDTGEDCDDSNTVTETCAYGLQSCTVCNATCHNGMGATAYCGDGVPNAPQEQCDDGNMITEACPFGVPSCTVCNATCQNAPGATSNCGDGAIDTAAGETCDNGAANTNACAYGQTSCSVCNTSCHTAAGTTSFCGDGVTDAANGEQCDGVSATCDATCHSIMVMPPVDGIAQAIPACGTCRETNCRDVDFSGIDALGSCFQSPTGTQSPANAQLCVDVLNCAYTNNCAYGSTGMNGCWCTGSPSVCQSTAGLDANHGVCFDKILAATKSEADGGDRNAILDRAIIRFSQEVFPSGAAFWMLECDRGHCAECAP